MSSKVNTDPYDPRVRFSPHSARLPPSRYTLRKNPSTARQLFTQHPDDNSVNEKKMISSVSPIAKAILNRPVTNFQTFAKKQPSKNNLESISLQNTELQNRVKEVSEEIERLKEDKESLTRHIEATSLRNEQLQSENSTSNQTISDLQNENQWVKTHLNEANQKIETLTNEKNKIEQQIEGLRNDKNKEINILGDDKITLNKQIETLKSQNESAKNGHLITQKALTEAKLQNAVMRIIIASILLFGMYQYSLKVNSNIS